MLSNNFLQTLHLKESSYKLQHTYAQASSEIPLISEVLEFTEEPKLDMQLGIRNRKSKEDTYTVELTVTVKATLPSTQNDSEQKVLFLIEVKQHGVFMISEHEETSLTLLLNIVSPTILYPYASAFVSDLGSRAGFSSLHLPALALGDFDALYHQQNKE